MNRSTILCLILILSVSPISFAGADESATVSIISYNVQFLPPPANVANKRSDPEYRARRIAEEVSQFDIVGLQETFHVTHRDQIMDGIRVAWKQPPNSVIAPKPDGFATSGGTSLFTRRPILESNSTVYKHFSKPEKYGFRADGFAAKGAIHARIALSKETPGRTVDLYVTHLEARDGDLRPLQFKELAAFIKETSDLNRPMILMGDLNTQGMTKFRDDPNSQYSQLCAELNGARPNGGVIDVWTELKADELGGTTEQESTEIGKRIDYIFVGNPKSPGPQLVPKSIEVKTYQDDKVIALSDHNAVVAQFEWKE